MFLFFRLEICRLEELNTQNEKRLDEKLHEIVQLNSQLEQLREESARQVARTKERAENVRRQLQMQISDMERQLVLSRASCRSAQKERDEVIFFKKSCFQLKKALKNYK